MSPLHGNMILGIRREDKNVWERRVPLTPEHVKQLKDMVPGLKIVVQPSGTRFFSDEQYIAAGAEIKEDLDECGTVIAVKEIPIRLLKPERTYMFFSHTIKAQPYNMAMLDHILAQRIRLIDYERIVGSNGKRTVFFGKHAGYAGMLDSFAALGMALLYRGMSNPFLYIPYSRQYPNLDMGKAAVLRVAELIRTEGLPRSAGPFIFGFTGRGNASKGSQEIFQLLPHKYVTIPELKALAESKDFDNKVVYGVEILTCDYTRRIDGAPFDKAAFKQNPEPHVSDFHETIAPYLTVLMNCMYWDVRGPRILTCDQTKALAQSGRLRMVCLGDITCDPGGSVEFMSKVTYIDSPVYYYDPLHEATSNHPSATGIIVMAVDNLPAEIPKSSCEFFGTRLLPLLPKVVASKVPSNESLDLDESVRPAVFTVDGKLTPQVAFINDLREERREKEHHILILGSGHVVEPAVAYLHRDERTHITVASMVLTEAEAIADRFDRVAAEELNVATVTDTEILNIFRSFDLVISLLPPKFHVRIAKLCLQGGKHLLTASYAGDEMMALHEDAKRAGLVFLNEMGLDPGIDHITAMDEISKIRKAGGKVRSFMSVCGGLPSPESSDNPLAYKFSWSPRGVLEAGKRPAQFLWQGEEKEVAPERLFHTAQAMLLNTGFDFEGYPNGNSLRYKEVYGLKHAHTLMRGTLRYRGFSTVMLGFAKLNLFDNTEKPYLMPDTPAISWREVLAKHLGVALDDVKAEVERLTADVPSSTQRSCAAALEWLGLFSEEPCPKKKTLIDSLCDIMKAKMSYGEDEHDMVFLHHEFGIEWADGRKEIRTSSLHMKGDNEASAMATLVGTPVGIGAQMILDGEVTERGVIRPVSEEFSSRAFKKLSEEGIIMKIAEVTGLERPDFG